jgi:hypothetical protein
MIWSREHLKYVTIEQLNKRIKGAEVKALLILLLARITNPRQRKNG